MGGNVQITNQQGTFEATRMDLTNNSRTSLVAKLLQSLVAFNKLVEKQCGLPLWNQQLIKDLGFLSGSAKHFFDLNSIEDQQFVSVKPSVGDIDTQVPLAMESLIQSALEGLEGKTCGDLKFIGFKKSAGQFITLWWSKSLDQGIQIDLELVDFENGKPTNWSNYSHSSSWQDMLKGVKGVFHKYAQRALSMKSFRDVVILKGKKKVPTVTSTTDLAFSVMKGLREKLKPVLDAHGKIVQTNGMDTFEEIPTSTSTYVTDIDVLFKMFFGHMPSKQEEEMMWSFVGIIDLVKKYWSSQEKSSFIIGFANTLWGPGAQALYRGDPAKDLDEKSEAFSLLTTELNVGYNKEQIESWKIKFYESY